jgi:hypothetical protein
MNYLHFFRISDPIPHTVPQVVFHFTLVFTLEVIFGLTFKATVGLTPKVASCAPRQLIS